MTTVELEVLGRILMLQSALHAAPDNQRLGELVCYTLSDVPGVSGCAIYLDDLLVSNATGDPGRGIDWPSRWKEGQNRTAVNSARLIALPLETAVRNYGFVILELFEGEAFQGYLPHLENTVNLIALMLENREQAAVLQSLNQDLEAEVRERVRSLQISEERLSLAQKGAKSGIWDWNLKTGSSFFDANYFLMAGYDVNEFPHSYEQWKCRVHPADIGQAEAHVEAYLAGLSSQFAAEFRFRTKQGEWMWILGQGIIAERDESGRPVRFTGSHTDIDERKQTESALRSSEESLRTTLDSIGDAVIATDADELVVRLNPVAEKLTGWSGDDAVGHPLGHIFRILNSDDREAAQNPANRVLETGEAVALRDNTVLIARNGSEHLVAVSAAPIRNTGSDMIGVVLVFRDISEEKALQEQFLQSQKMETVGQLAGGIAHDFNNMLGGIMGAAELLKRKLSADPKTDKFLGMILDSAERAAGLTTKLLAFSRKQHLSSTPVDGHAALRNAIALLENSVDKRVLVKADLAAETSMVVGDLSQLQNVFLNLCLNAAQAMPGGGEITVSTEVIELDKVYCETSLFDLQPGPFLEVEIRDSGCGIRPENLERIFEPFFTTKEQGKGTGLGLAAVLGTVQLHHGAVTAYSELGTGSVFHVQLPLSDAPSPTIIPSAQPIYGSGLVLVVDDEAVMRATAEAILVDLGYEVLMAENGRIGVERFSERQAEINLVLLDMIMPEMNGRDCFSAIKKIDPDARIVLTSGFTRSADLDDLRSDGLTGFIRKPYRAAALSRTIAAALGQDQANISMAE